MFPNPYIVYLHDTPSKSLFDKDQRTFSSGCIRVQKAFELAELVLERPGALEPGDDGRGGRHEEDADRESREAGAGADPVLDGPAACRTGR